MMAAELRIDRRSQDELKLSTAVSTKPETTLAPPLPSYPQRRDQFCDQEADRSPSYTSAGVALSHEPLLTDFDLERLTGRARSSWQKARLMGTGPPFIRLGRLERYRPSEFNAWLSAHPSLRSTSDVAEAKLEDETRHRGRRRKVQSPQEHAYHES
jgi:hypothetical protein